MQAWNSLLILYMCIVQFSIKHMPTIGSFMFNVYIHDWRGTHLVRCDTIKPCWLVPMLVTFPSHNLLVSHGLLGTVKHDLCVFVGCRELCVIVWCWFGVSIVDSFNFKIALNHCCFCPLNSTTNQQLFPGRSLCFFHATWNNPWEKHMLLPKTGPT